MKPGIYHDISSSEYHDGPGLSRTRLARLLSGTPLEFKRGVEVEETDAMRLGTATHMAILEPERFRELVRPQPKWDRRTKAGKEAEALWLEAHQGKIGVPEEDYAVAQRAADMVRSKRGPATALREGRAEVSLYWEQGGVLVKSRPDFIDFERGIVVDVKTTKSSPDDAQYVRTMVDYYGAMQQAMILNGAAALGKKIEACYLLMVTLTEPLDMRLVQVSLDWLEYGEQQFLKALRIYKECSASNSWPGYADLGVQEVACPEWVRKRTEALVKENTEAATEAV